MADSKKAKEAIERLERAKRDAVDAETADAEAIVEDASQSAGAESETAPEGDAASSNDAPPAPKDPAASVGEAKNPMEDAAPAGGEAATPEEPAFVDIAETDPPAPPPPPADEETVSLAATALKFIAILVAGGALSLWAGPKIAPNLPGWAAPVAEFLTPGADRNAEAVAALKSDTDAALAVLREELAATREAAAAGPGDDAFVALEERLRAEIEAAAAPAPDLTKFEGGLGDLAARLTASEATLQGLRSELDALAGFAAEGASPSAETLERVAAFGASVEGLRSEVSRLSEAAAKVESRAAAADLAALAARVEALEGGQAATAGAQAEADRIVREASLDVALTRIGQALTAGTGFESALADAVGLSGVAAPKALSIVSENGVPTRDALAKTFRVAAQDAYAAALEAEAGDGLAEGVFAKLQGKLGGRPAVETEGSDAGAVLSRIEARLAEGQLEAAKDEAAALPEASAAAMAPWLAALGRAAGARAALRDWRAALATN